MGVDLDDLAGEADGADFLGVQGDATDSCDGRPGASRWRSAPSGPRLLVVNAGVFPGAAATTSLSDDAWARRSR